MSSLQEALVTAGLARPETLQQKEKEQCVDNALQNFIKIIPTTLTFHLIMKEIEWRMNPLNKGKSRADFIAHAREQMLSCM